MSIPELRSKQSQCWTSFGDAQLMPYLLKLIVRVSGSY